jgi:hypothetical protein
MHLFAVVAYAASSVDEMRSPATGGFSLANVWGFSSTVVFSASADPSQESSAVVVVAESSVLLELSSFDLSDSSAIFSASSDFSICSLVFSSGAPTGDIFSGSIFSAACSDLSIGFSASST